ncbi:unnamed protein product [Adineta ricciae]|uniref:TOD1/MUCI70 glycosyltransferase-like domain-containing protein n=1 Tax=Adineta ricciae TaxID=249248 RepID=A0A813TCA2_ADIRI|nr:unnamed protein product [Adineta ricciae]CAF1380140.1 unnamed protein product [Adineta ricciae]
MNLIAIGRRFCGFMIIIALNFILIVYLTLIVTHSHVNIISYFNNFQLETSHGELLNTSFRQIGNVIWTHDGSGLMKYIQWIVSRKLSNVKILRLNINCYITNQSYFSLASTSEKLLQIHIVSLTTDSKCSAEISHMIDVHHSIYFIRKSILAMLLYQDLDSTGNSNVLNLHERIEQARKVIKTISNHTELKVIYAEDLIHVNLTNCESLLKTFLSILGYQTSTNQLKSIIEYDSHQFIQDATWWDQSEVAERLLTNSIPSRSSNLTYSTDFYHLHGNRTFAEYLLDNRKCYNDGTFAQMQSETMNNRSSVDKPDRCLSKSFDCKFSDIYSFDDREQLYKRNNRNPVKCGFAIPSIFDTIRKRYGRNEKCHVIIFTVITNCYDHLPEIHGRILASFCCVALLDAQTIRVHRNLTRTKSAYIWNIIDLGNEATPFVVSAKSTETLKTLGQRMFPLAKWIIWLDGKAHIKNIQELLTQARSPMIGARHPDERRTSASEVEPTIIHLRGREKLLSNRLNETLFDIKLQENEYQREGFYSRLDLLKLKMFDIAVFLHRNNHPCTFRQLCEWHNEVNYFSFRGQLSTFYPAVRLHLTQYLQFLPEEFYSTFGHRSVC